jgi:phospholipase C
MSRLVTSRREIMQAMGALGGAAALGGCTADSQQIAQQEEQIFQCWYNGREKNALQKRGVFGEIQHIVVLMMENRSFDHYFGARSIPVGATDDNGNDLGGEGRRDVNGLTGEELNLDLDGNRVGVQRLTETLYGDIAHEWDNCQRQFDWEGSGVGRMDGFVREHETDIRKQGEESYCATYKYFGKNLGCPPKNFPMGIYTREELPIYYALADSYTLCDNWYSSVLGPTWPNRFYMHACTSGGETGNKPVLGKRTIWEKMREQCLRCLNYYCDLPWAHVVGEGALLGLEVGDGVFGGVLEQFHASQPGFGSFYETVRKDNLPAFTIIDPGYSSGYDDHPPADIALGQAFVSYIYRILASNPKVWAKTLFIITYDEHGSFYDHVVPPGADAKDANGDPMAHTLDEYPHMRQLGVRVPALVIGPHVKKGYVSHAVYDHCSIAATAYDRFDLAANKVGYINERQRHTNTLADCIDGGIYGGNTPPPIDIPVLEFSESELMDWAERPFPDGQPGLARMVETGEIPREHDLRPYRKDNLREFLEIGEMVGAFKVNR